MRLSKIHEALDDADAFEPNCWCTYPDANGNEVFDLEYHVAHQEAEAAERAVPGWDRHSPSYTQERNDELDRAMVKAYDDVMVKHGFIYDKDQDDWIKNDLAKSIREALDDTDKFERDCVVCKEQDVMISLNRGISASRPDPDEFHDIHSTAWRAAAATGKQSKALLDEYEDAMNRHGYYSVSGSHGRYWVKEPDFHAGDPRMESLDDKDEFRHDPVAPQRRIRRHPAKKCAFCQEVDMHSRPFWYDDQAWSYEVYGIKKEGRGNPLQFHMLHQYWAELNNDINIWNVRNDLALTDNFRVFMAKYGWVPKPGEYDDILSWMKKPVQEALDDKDTFESCELCSLHLGNPTLADIENFHNAHTAADQEYGSGSGWHRVMARYGYRIGALGWEIIKEDLDDKDEFDKNCNWYLCDLRDTDRDEFHTAHIAASQAATRATKDSADHLRPDEIEQLWKNVFYETMNKHGYVHKPSTSKSVGDWAKKSVQESLDDKDEFTSGLIATGKIKEVNSYAGTEWVLTFKHAGDTSQGTEQERIIYALPKATFGKFPKYTWINGVRFDVEVIMDMDGTIGFYDDGDIREIDG